MNIIIFTDNNAVYTSVTPVDSKDHDTEQVTLINTGHRPQDKVFMEKVLKTLMSDHSFSWNQFGVGNHVIHVFSGASQA